ncbi:quinone oxidoreductase family protein [Spirillospora sp. NBC_01491]|uniref:quinone oxidoreductase family protein n=1 Tax=Spirillospora sp. NBC_01491 TaxID=2976007 RepID=UPI002E34716F|nr:zinc-binding dehydrogenase [Spirillospora sp. NBC_01491]
MRRIRYHEYGDPEVLKIEEADVPEPGPGQVLVRVEAIGAHFVDTKSRQGPTSGALFQRPLPGKPGGDVVGTVEAVGDGADPALIGARVAALVGEDAYADYVTADTSWLVLVPDGLDTATATVLPMAAPVALGALRIARTAPGETVLVHSAAGGIGHLAVQLAKLLGAGTVIATASAPDKLAFTREHGADAAVDHTRGDWPDRVRDAAPHGVDVVLDAVGGDVLRHSVDLLAPLGRAVTYGAASGDLTGVPLTSVFGLRTLTGFTIMGWRKSAPEQARRDVAEATEHAAAGRLRTAVHARLPLTEAATAHRLLEERTNLGRVLLLP